MKILFYTEPHGLRDSFTSHKLPYDYFRRIAREINTYDGDLYEGVSARVFANHFVSTMEFDANYQDWPFVIQPTISEQRDIENTSKMWMGEGIEDWISLMTDPESEIVKLYVEMLLRVKEEVFNFDILVCWGENMAVREAARITGARTVFLELASMRSPFPKSILIDPIGVNGSASTTNMSMQMVKDSMRPLPINLVPMLINEEFARGTQNVTMPRALFKPLSQELRAFLDGDHPRALVPLQLADDANQLLYSDFDSVDSFASAAINPLLEAGFKVIVKPHPHARMRGGYVIREQNDCMRKFASIDNVLVLSEHEDHDQYISLLKAIDIVVTNNSSAGFEALMLGKVTVTLGRSCYSFKDGLPTLQQAISAIKLGEITPWISSNQAYIVSYMLACAFPLERKLGAELIKRLKIWGKFGHKNVHEWVPEIIKDISWDTWYQRDFMKNVTGIKHDA